MGPMGDHQNPWPTLELLPYLPHIERGQPCLAHSRRNCQQGTPKASLSNTIKRLQSRNLPRPRIRNIRFVETFGFEVFATIMLGRLSILVDQPERQICG